MDALDLLQTRRSAMVKTGMLQEPGPDAAQLETILTAATRVPDHGKTNPFYFLVFEGDARIQAGEIFAKYCPHADNPDACETERTCFLRAPMVIGVIYRARMAKNPLWEQMMSAGAACQNLILAAHALGFGAQWLTEWVAYDDNVRRELGLDERDTVAGFIYLGTQPETQEDRDRPDLSQIVNHWAPDAPLKKGDQYDREKFGFPKPGFSLPRDKN